jgi:hypothetical protein
MKNTPVPSPVEDAKAAKAALTARLDAVNRLTAFRVRNPRAQLSDEALRGIRKAAHRVRCACIRASDAFNEALRVLEQLADQSQCLSGEEKDRLEDDLDVLCHCGFSTVKEFKMEIERVCRVQPPEAPVYVPPRPILPVDALPLDPRPDEDWEMEEDQG